MRLVEYGCWDAQAILGRPDREVIARAKEVRNSGTRLITYSPKVLIPLTQPAGQVLEVARAGAQAGCTEALLTLGDNPELRDFAARDGHDSAVSYVAEICELILRETTLLPHVHAGVLTAAEMARLREVSVSQGLMGSPDTPPTRGLEMLETAGRLAVPFTTGILVGRGETRAERLDAIRAIADAHARHGHVQAVIVQTFRAEPGTLMAEHPEPSIEELLWTAAAARLLLPGDVHLQAPPNLSDDAFLPLIDAGIDDWGGISPAEARGFSVAPRLPLYPSFVADLDRWCASEVATAVRRNADADGLARGERWSAGTPGSIPERFLRPSHRPRAADPPVAAALARSAQGAELEEDDLVALFGARGDSLAAVASAADDLRRAVCGDDVTYVVTRNINYTNVCYFRCGFCAFSKGKLARNLRGAPYVVPLDEILRRCHEAWDRGAVEVCLQGGIHPGFTGDFYADVCEAIKRELPDLHVHAFSALEVWQGAATLGVSLEDYLRRLQATGLASLPGTAAEVLDDEVRAVLCPDKVTTAQWLEIHETAHRVGLRSTTTIMFGHVDAPRHWARHLVALRDLQRRTGGFTEFVPLPFVHDEAPIYLRGGARRGPTFRESILMHAVARLALHPHITNIQASWVKLGTDGAHAILRAGANDLGGTLMNESISRAAGASHGQELPPEAMEATIRAIGRTPRQRTTLYGRPHAGRTAASFGAAPLNEPLNPPAREAGLRRPAVLLRPAHSG